MTHYHITARNKATGAIVEFDRDDELDSTREACEARLWCEDNGYELIGVEEL